MKWALFTAAVLVALGVGRALRGSPRVQLALWTVVGFLPFFHTIGMGLVFDREHPGDAHGLEVGLLDIVVITLWAARAPSRHPVPYRWLVAAYVAAAALSLLQAQFPLPALFYVWNLSRAVLLFGVLANATRASPLVAPAVLRGLLLGVLYQFALVLWQRYGLGLHQVTGTFGHQNALGVALNLVLMVPIAALLARHVTWLSVAAPVAGFVTIVLTLSRGALLVFLVGVVIVFALSLLRGQRTRKLIMAGAGLLVLGAIFARGSERIIVRFETAPAASLETRERFNRAAARMLADHPLGVGVNHFAWTLKHRGYGEREGLYGSNRDAIVHNLYWLTLAEMSYWGLAALMGLLLIPIFKGYLAVLRAPSDLRADVLIGVCVGMTLCGVHGFVEWVWRATEVSYVYWSLMALSAGLIRELRQAKRSV